MLKIKFIRIENILLMKVLEQGNEIMLGSGTLFVASNGVVIKSVLYPSMCDDILYINGNEPFFGYICDNYENTTQAIHALIKYTKAISEYNKSLKEVESVTICDVEDSEIIVAE